MSPDNYQLIGHNFRCYYSDSDGALVELLDVTNLQSGTSIFIHDDSFCNKEFLELLEKVGYKSFSAFFAYASVRNVEKLRAKMNDESFQKKMKMLGGDEMEDILMDLEKVLKEKK